MGDLNLGVMWLYSELVKWLRNHPQGSQTFGVIAKGLKRHLERARDAHEPILWEEEVKPYTLKRLVQRIQDALGTNDLIRRDPDSHQLRASDVGLQVFRQFEGMLAFLPGLRDGPRRDPAQPLRVGVCESIAAEILPGALRGWLADSRWQVRPRFGRLDYHTLRDELLRHELDVGIGWCVEGYDFSDLTILPLGPPLPLVLITPRGAPFLGAERPEPGRLFFLTPSDVHMPGVAEFVEQSRPGKPVEVISFQAVLSHVRYDGGVGIVPLFRWVLGKLWEKGDIVYQELPTIPAQSLTLYLPPAGERPAHVQAFLEAVRGNVARLFSAPASRPAGDLQGPHRSSGTPTPHGTRP